MTMNDATKMAVTLARKGASDEVIALVMEALTTHREHIDAARSAAVTASPAAREMAALTTHLRAASVPQGAPSVAREVSNERHVERNVERPLLPQSRTVPPVVGDAARAHKRYAPLLAAMRADVVRATNEGQELVTTLRDMTAPHEPLLKAAAPNPESPTSLRGLASLVGNARTRWGGVVGGMRFTATGDVADHRTNYVYRVVAV